MPTVNVYRADTKIDTKYFYKDFMIIAEQGDNKLRWEADEETASQKGGSILIWIRSAMEPPEIHFVPPGWELTIDGTSIITKENVDPNLRFEVPVEGKVIELKSENLLFICYL